MLNALQALKMKKHRKKHKSCTQVLGTKVKKQAKPVQDGNNKSKKKFFGGSKTTSDEGTNRSEQ